MEQSTQPQQSMPPIPQSGKKKIIVATLITAIIIGMCVYFLMTNNSGKNSGKQITKALSQPTSSPEINPKDYSLVSYPIQQSPAYGQFNCEDPSWGGSMTRENDTRLLKNNSEIIIPSLIQFISTYRPAPANENTLTQSDCSISVEIFSSPIKGKYLYIGVTYTPWNDAPGITDFDEIYRLDLSNLSAEIIPFWFSDGMYNLLPDGKTVIDWDMNGINLSNLETMSTSTLYIAPKNQTLIYSIEVDDGAYNLPWAIYDVEIDANKIMVGVYDKTATQDGKPITIISVDDGIVDSEPYADMIGEKNAIKLRFIDRIIIPIPVN